MTQERWQQVKSVLDEALERSGPERAIYLENACLGDEELRQEVESLLVSETEAEDFIETPVFRICRDDDKPLPEGQRIGAYRIVREAGRGGMGTVYVAERADEQFRRQVAIKVVRRGMDTDEILRRFRAERQILANLGHPNIAGLLDSGTTEDGRPYFVLEWVEGQPIDKYCDTRHLSTRDRLVLFRKVCSAVHFAHQNLVVHRDLKPGNILVTAEGEPKLLDFGIAKLLDPGEEALAFTRVDLRPMTPEYASPEQVRGEAITTASDVYALGVLLYLLLTGHHPFKTVTRDPQSLAKAICETSPPRPSSVVGRADEVRRVPEAEVPILRRRLAGDLDNIVLMAMKKEPQRRYASVDQFSNDLERHLEGLPVIARKDTVGYRTAKFVGRHKFGVGIAALVLLVIVGFSVSVTLLWQRAVQERERSDQVTAFLVDLFQNPDPKNSRGEDITAFQVLGKGVETINTSLAKQPELRADLLETMGRVYRNLGLLEPARELLERSLALRRKQLRPNDPKIAQVLFNLSNVQRDLGRDKAAEPLIWEGIAIQRKNGDTGENRDYAFGLNNLAAIIEDEDPDQALALYQESLSIKRRLPKLDENDIAISLNNVGKLYYEKGDFKAAEPSYREALAIRRKLSKGLPDPDTAKNIGNLATLLEDTGDLDGAIKFHREALAMRRKLFEGRLHSAVATSLNNLGHALQTKGNLTEAEQCYREAVDIAKATLSENHPNRAAFIRNFASVLLDLKRPIEAEAQAREAVDVLKRGEEPKPAKIADAESVLGASLAAQRRFDEAEPLLTKSYQVLSKETGSDARYAPEALKRVVDFYRAWGKPEEAARLGAQATRRAP